MAGTAVAGVGMTRLSELTAALPETRCSTPVDPDVTGVTHDSRRVGPGSVFVAIRGQQADGLDFVDDAVARGAAAVVADRPAPAGFGGAAWVEVDDVRAALARLARAWWGAPDRELTMAGITGTNGKTTTAVLLAAALDAAGLPAGIVGTLGATSGAGWRHAGLTTPEAPDLFERLHEMRAGGRRAAVLEVSSHALVQKRVETVEFDVAIFTNLSRDHLDFHRDMESYFAAKARLFAGLPPNAAMAVNLDDPFGTRLNTPPRPRVVTYGRTTRAAVLPLDMETDRGGMRLRIRTPSGDVDLRSRLVGRPNLYNILAALAAICALDLDPARAAKGIESVHGIPGRAETVDEGQDFAVLVDFAHTDDALLNVLTVARELADGRVIVVFGCGGDRDTTKRPLMGAAAARLADVAILTSDNPRTEDPGAIIEQVSAGFEAVPDRAECLIEPDRRSAIRAAIARAQPGDVVLIAGKGHETEQILADRRIPFDDRDEARQALRARFGKDA